MNRARRLTPLECERLQGFPDYWVQLPKKDSFTDEEFEFWQNARKEELKMEGKKYLPKTRSSLLKWYNKMIEADANKYKALGNSIAIPFAYQVMQNMKRHMPEATMGSLFDGIGGFPLAFSSVYGKDTTKWASEVAAFPIAVTRYHFGNK